LEAATAAAGRLISLSPASDEELGLGDAIALSKLSRTSTPMRILEGEGGAFYRQGNRCKILPHLSVSQAPGPSLLECKF